MGNKNDSYIVYSPSEINSLVELVDEAIKSLHRKATDETEKEIKARYENSVAIHSTFWFKFKSFIFYDIKKLFTKKKTNFETYEEYKERVWKSFYRCNIGTTLKYIEFLNQMVLNAKKNGCGFELSFSDHKILVRLLDENDLYIYSLNRAYE